MARLGEEHVGGDLDHVAGIHHADAISDRRERRDHV
jgi:hypothetical protein